MRIAKNSQIYIVAPEAATERERFAANELLKYLRKIFSCDVTIGGVHSPKDEEICVYIGGPGRNTATREFLKVEEFERLVPGPEGVMIKSFGERVLILAGSSRHEKECERGTIYAVYEFLERYLGVSLAAYTKPDIPGGEHVPQYTEKILSDIEYIKAAADSQYRTAIVQYADEAGNPVHALNISFLDWLVKNRYNRILTWSSVYEAYKQNGMLREAEKRGFRFTVGHHESSQLFLPPRGNSYFPEHYYETHPEYYKLLPNGERFCPKGFYGQWIFCSRNEACIHEIAGHIIAWISQNPLVDIIAFWPQDGMEEQCTCEKCAPYSKVFNYTYFLNAVAKEVSLTYPHVKIDMLVYVDLWECPEGIQLAPSLIVDEATWHDSGLRRGGKPDGSGIIGTFFESNLQKWKKAGAEVVFYDYYMGVYPARQRYLPMADEIQNVSRHFTKTGVMGTGTQIECFNLWNHLFNFYCFARCAYDNGLSFSENLERFSQIFGAGSQCIKTMICEAEMILDGQVALDEAGLYFMEHVDKAHIYQLFEDALSAAESPSHRNNIRLMRMAFRYSDLESQEARNKTWKKYNTLEKYEDPTGELALMSRHFDSFKKNDPGYGIAIPVDCTEKSCQSSYWYTFEGNINE